MMARPRPDIPRATLRLQLNAGFTFDDAAAIVPYMADLGISHVYASPFTMARPGSPHGYDVIDHRRINPELGGEDGLKRLHAALEAHDMGLILDFVPNHMGIGGADNPYWLDLLEWGEESLYAHWFDIDWQPFESTLAGKVLVPFLGAPYGEVLERGELSLRFDGEEGSFSVWYYEHRLPVSPRAYADILARASGASSDVADLAERAKKLARRPARRRRRADRDEADAIKAALAAIAGDKEQARADLDAAADAFNGAPGHGRSWLDLHRLLERQAYRPAYWRVASDEINYRRFFDINDLAGLRMEDADVFETSHSLLFRLIEDGIVTGVRLDHVDGLYDPEGYCRSLQETAAQRLGGDADELPLYLLVEKILAPFERLPEDWAVHGTSGYDFMSVMSGVFVNPDAERMMTRLYGALTGRPTDFDAVVERAKPQILRNNLSSEFTVIARRLSRLAKRHWRTRDFTYQSLRSALTDIVAHFPVYRTYIAGGAASESDRRYMEWAVAQAKKTPGLVDESVYDFIHAVLLADWHPGPGARGVKAEVREIARKFQQLTGPVTAKSVEDTAFYRYTRFLALNEVGSEPSRWSVSPNAFHHAMAERAERAPAAMLASATHDHKRGEDVRARLHVLSEKPLDWSRTVRRFARLNRNRRRMVDGEPAPGRNAEYLFYQTLVGCWPLDLDVEDEAGLETLADRLSAYMIKAVREAKLRTNWAKPDADYENAVEQFVRATLGPARASGFLRTAAAFVAAIAPAGAVNGLAQAVLKYTAPGVPDLYQGTDYWDFSLVDPDNRRAVDYAARWESLRGLADADPPELAHHWRDGRVKQFVIAKLLELRRQKPGLFVGGSYERLLAAGPAADHVLAFERRSSEHRLILAVPRLAADALGEGEGLALDGGFYRDTVLEADVTGLTDLFTGAKAEGSALEPLFARFPLAVLSG